MNTLIASLSTVTSLLIIISLTIISQESQKWEGLSKIKNSTNLKSSTPWVKPITIKNAFVRVADYDEYISHYTTVLRHHTESKKYITISARGVFVEVASKEYIF